MITAYHEWLYITPGDVVIEVATGIEYILNTVVQCGYIYIEASSVDNNHHISTSFVLHRFKLLSST